MKKIFALILCLMLICVAPLVAAAEVETDAPIVTEDEATENLPTEEETPVEDEITPPEEVPEETPTETPEAPEEVPEQISTEGETTGEDVAGWDDVKETLSGAIKEWIEPNLEEIGVIVTLIGYGIVLFKKLRTIIKSASTINNNAIAITEKNRNFMSQALSNIETASGVVTSYDARIVALLEAFQQTAEDKKRLEAELVEIKSFLKTSTAANIEFANELAELLGLANIPNYKKEEIGARHLESVKAILEAEKKAEAVALIPATTEEAKEDVGETKEN